MSAGYASSASIAYAEDRETASVGEVLRLLSAGVPGEILLALREGAMQTKVLTHQVKGYTPRTIYRYLPRLAGLGAIERDDEPGGPARVLHTLNGGSGRELAGLLDRFGTAAMKRLPNGQIDSTDWTSLGLLADLWEAGVVEALSNGPTSPTELTNELGCLSYHQLNRRASRFKDSGFFCESRQSRRQRRCYALTRKARRTMGLIAGIGRWRGRHLAADGEPGLTVEEMATVLRVVLPLAKETGRTDDAAGFQVEGVGETIEVRSEHGATWARGTVEDWMEALLDGEPSMETGDEPAVVRAWLARLYEELWAPASAAVERG
jgi:DNA-binding HxlR family transcriptional regulator